MPGGPLGNLGRPDFGPVTISPFASNHLGLPVLGRPGSAFAVIVPPSHMQGRPTTVYTNLAAAQGGRTGQVLTTIPVAYIPSVSSIGTAAVGGSQTLAPSGSRVLLYAAIGLGLLVALALVRR